MACVMSFPLPPPLPPLFLLFLLFSSSSSAFPPLPPPFLLFLRLSSSSSAFPPLPPLPNETPQRSTDGGTFVNVFSVVFVSSRTRSGRVQGSSGCVSSHRHAAVRSYRRFLHGKSWLLLTHGFSESSANGIHVIALRVGCNITCWHQTFPLRGNVVPMCASSSHPSLVLVYPLLIATHLRVVSVELGKDESRQHCLCFLNRQFSTSPIQST